MGNKTAYERKLENQLSNWEQEYQVLKARADRFECEPGSGLSHAVSYLNEKRSVATVKLDKLKAADEQEWEALQDEIDEAWSNLGIALKSLAIQLTKQSSP